MRWKRSPEEIFFRLRQEAWNLLSYYKPPQPGFDVTRFERLLPVSEVDREVSEKVAHGQIPLLGTEILLKEDIDWRRDPIGGKTSGLEYFRRLPYLNAAIVGDHKAIWELNRHQHLVVLAQSGHIAELERQLNSWLESNPFHQGINWASALEVAIRAISWVRILGSVGDKLDHSLRQRMLECLYRHGCHIERNLSVYFAPNTHLLGEAVALYLLGRFWPQSPMSEQWKSIGAAWTERCMSAQVDADGSHFEGSSYYQIYCVDFFLLYARLASPKDSFHGKLRKMCEFLAALCDQDGSIVLLGDDDGGRLDHPFGERRSFAKESLTQASEFLGARYEPGRRNAYFPDAGVVVAGDAETQIVFCAHGIARGTGGHSHAHALHFTLRRGGIDLLLDRGTYTYVGDAAVRNDYRSNRAHNTVRVDDFDQATPVHAFRWAGDRWRGSMEELQLEEGAKRWRASLSDPQRRFRIERTIDWSEPKRIVVEDLVEAESSEHRVEQFWQVPVDCEWSPTMRQLQWPCGALLQTDSSGLSSFEDSKVSSALYHQAPAKRLRLEWRTKTPLRLRTVILL